MTVAPDRPQMVSLRGATRRRRLVAAALLLAATATATPAAAETPAPPSATIAQDGAMSLRASDADDQLCLELVMGEVAEGSGCATSAADGVLVQADAGHEPDYVGVGVTAAATTVEVRRAGKLLTTATTVVGEAYRGRQAGTVRFALLRLPAGVRQDGLRIRALDAAGQVRQVLDGHDGDLVLQRRALLSGRTGAVRWRLSSERLSSLRPTLADLDHEARSWCVRVTVVAGADSGSDSSASCVGEEPLDTLIGLAGIGDVDAQERCTPRVRLLHGVVRGDAVKVSVLRADGRRVAVRTVPVPGTGLTTYAYAAPAGLGLRSVRIQPRGDAAPTEDLAYAPLSVRCALKLAGDFGVLGWSVYLPSFDSPPPVAGLGPATTVAGSTSFRVADGPGQSLCLAAGERPFTLADCRLVAPGFEALPAIAHGTVDASPLVLALPAAVATVRFSRAGVQREVSTVAGDGYTGPYAGKVRFASFELEPSPAVGRVDLLDDAGNVLHTALSLPGGVPEARPRPSRIAGRVGGPSLWQDAWGSGAKRVSCLALTAGSAPGTITCGTSREVGVAVLLRASCATRRLTVAVTAPGPARVVAITSDGRRRVLALRRGAGLLTLAPSIGLRSLSVVDRAGRRAPLELALRAPAGARQCGWEAAANPAARTTAFG